MDEQNPASSAPRRFHTATFEKADESRREALLAVAIRAFADKGYNGTSVNAIAREAGVSIGSLYSYFPSKEDLFLSIIERGRGLLEAELGMIEGLGLMEAFEALLRAAARAAKAEPEINQIYLDATTQGLRGMAERLSRGIEEMSASFYRRLLDGAAARGELRPGLELGAAAFCLDNLLLLFQFSFSSAYYRDRLRIFLGLGMDEEPDEEGLIRSIVEFARGALLAS